MKVIGLTGGAGSGKSFVSEIIAEEFNYPIIDSDKVAKSVVKKGNKIFRDIVEYFGEEILDENGNIDRSKLADVVFSDKEKLKVLNSFIHPATISIICNKLNNYQMMGKKYVFVESAIALESGYGNFCDEFWFVASDENDRRKRLKESRGYSDEKIDAIFAAQNISGEVISKCAHIIRNPQGVAKEYIIATISKYL